MAQPLSGSDEELLPVVYSGPYADLRPVPQDCWNLCFRDFTFRELATTITSVNHRFRKIAIQTIHARIHASLEPFTIFFKRPAMVTGAPAYQFAYAEQIYCQMKMVKGDLLNTIPLQPSNYFAEISHRLGRLNHGAEIEERTVRLLYYGDYRTARLACNSILFTTQIGCRILDKILRDKRFRLKNEWTLTQEFNALARFANQLPLESGPHFYYTLGELFNLEQFNIADEILGHFPKRKPLDMVQVLAGQTRYWRGTYVYSHRLPISEERDQCLLSCLNRMTTYGGNGLVEFFEVVHELQSEHSKKEAREIFAAKLSRQKNGKISWDQFKILVSTAYPGQISFIEKETRPLLRKVHFVTEGLKRRRSDQ